MKTFVFLLLFISINLNAYCISNKTNQELLFMVESYIRDSDSIIVFKKYIKPNETQCCKVGNDNCNPTKNMEKILSFYAFSNNNAVEGCDIFGFNDSNVILTSYQVFDNCIWE